MRIVKLVLLVAVLLLLSGCNISLDYSVSAKESEVNQYNKMVNDTLNAYIGAVSYANKNKDDLLTHVVKGEEWSLASELNPLDTLTDDEKESFKLYGVVTDHYFTALGADKVREVITISGLNHMMYITIIWGTDHIVSLDRVVLEI